MTGNRNQSLAERFWTHVLVQDGCWAWRGSVAPKGYGSMQDHKHRLRGHRVSWVVNRGPIPAGMHVLHTCDNPPCTNPDHLWLGTNLDNVRDRDAKHRRVAPRGSASGRSRLTERDIPTIRAEYASGRTIMEIARSVGVGWATVRDVVREKTWRHV